MAGLRRNCCPSCTMSCASSPWHAWPGRPPGQTLQATALVHEAWLRMVGAGDRTWQNRAHFFGAAAEAMRRILIENARRKARLKRGGGQQRMDIEEVDLAAATPDEKVLLMDEALEQLQKQDPEKARIVVLKFFGGLTNQEVSGEFSASPNAPWNVNVAYAKASGSLRKSRPSSKISHANFPAPVLYVGLRCRNQKRRSPK